MEENYCGDALSESEGLQATINNLRQELAQAQETIKLLKHKLEYEDVHLHMEETMEESLVEDSEMEETDMETVRSKRRKKENTKEIAYTVFSKMEG